MSHEEFETLALDLLEATMNIASIYKVDEKRLVEELNRRSPSYDCYAACIAFAFRYGMKTAFDTWSVLQKGPVRQKTGTITILGGGCCFELPVLMHFLKSQNQELTVRIIDPVPKWKIFHPMHVRLAEKIGMRLHLEYVPVIDILEQIDSYKTDLLVSMNNFSGLSFTEKKVLRIANANCNRHLFWHSSLSVMQDIFSASYVPMRDEMNFEGKEELTAFVARHFPGLKNLNLFANLGKKGFYLMRNLSFVKSEYAESSPQGRHFNLPTGSLRSG